MKAVLRTLIASVFLFPATISLVTKFSPEWWKCSFPLYKRDFQRNSPGPVLGLLTRGQESTHFCEAALISPHLAITSFECLQDNYDDVFYVYRVSGSDRKVRIVDMDQVEGTDQAVCLLDNEKAPLPGPYVTFLLSGRGATESRENYAPEAQLWYPASVSSLLLGLADIETLKLSFLSGNQEEADANLVTEIVTLKSETDGDLPLSLKAGATFLKELPNCNVAIFGVYSSSTDNFITEGDHENADRTVRAKQQAILPKKSTAKKAEKKTGRKKVSARRIKQYTKADLVRAVRREFAQTRKSDLDTLWKKYADTFYRNILDQVTLGTLNMNGLSRLERSQNDDVKMTIRKIIFSTDVIAFQEAAKQPNQLDHYDTIMPFGYRFEGGDQFGFAYNSVKFALIDQCQPYNVKKNREQTLRSNFLFRCNFKKVGGANDPSSCFSLYTVHLADSDQQLRRLQLKVVAQVMQSEVTCRGKILLGDFNWPNLPNEINAVSEIWYLNFEQMDPGISVPPSIIPPGADPDDPGYTTPGRGEYDFILCDDKITLSRSYTIVGAIFPSTINSAADLEQHYLNYFTPDRQGAPLVRSVALSDHLPVIGTVLNANRYPFRVATWNMQNFQYIASGLSIGRKELRYAEEYQRVFQFQAQGFLKIQIAAIQEIQSFAQDPAFPVDAFGMKWHSQLVQTTRYNGRKERLGFAYDPNTVLLQECKELKLSPNGNQGRVVERPALACRFTTTDEAQEIIVVNVHMVNEGSPTWSSREDIISRIRAHFNLNSGNIVIAGDFNMDLADATKDFRSRRARCPIYGNNNWEFTRVASKKTLDYIFAPGQTYPGQGLTDCYTFHPELVQSVIAVDNSRRGKVFSSWLEISDHFPVFMKFWA